jgi:hypothetical protein
MTIISNPASPGYPTQVVAEQPIRAPLAGGIPWANHSQHPAVAGFPVAQPGSRDAHVQAIPTAVVDALTGRAPR